MSQDPLAPTDGRPRPRGAWCDFDVRKVHLTTQKLRDLGLASA